ncbi:MAG: hypoxanthine/guanine phosphoribosyltransferase [Candidatus Thermoplasmatota archaeon]
MLELLRSSLNNCPITKFGDYEYFVHPITDGIPAVEPLLLNEVAAEIERVAEKGWEKIVTAEAMGIHIATALSIRTGKPFTVIRKRQYSLPGEVRLQQVTGYSKGAMFVNGLNKGDKVIFVDDVLSTGGTLRAIVHTLRSMGVLIRDIVIVFEKGEGKAALESELAQEIKTLLKVEVVDGRVRIVG